MKVVIIRGLTGSGKTTLLNEIVKSFHFEKVEVDDIKRKKYGTTERCTPNQDFPEAGRIAKKLVDDGNNVVIEETFTDLDHIALFKKGFDDLDNHDITYIQLKTSLQSAKKRKVGILNPSLIETIYKERATPISGELIYDTDSTNIDKIISDLKHILSN